MAGFKLRGLLRDMRANLCTLRRSYLPSKQESPEDPPAAPKAGFEGIALVLPRHPSGALLLLRKASDISTIEVLDGQVEVELKSDLAAVVVRGLDALDATSALSAAYEYANRAFDLIGMRGNRNLMLDDPSVTYGVWWSDGTKRVLRIASAATMSVTMTASFEVGGEQGNVLTRPPPAQPAWHESMRYFRMSQTTDDLFDAFRNIYLALESVLSFVAPVRLRANGAPDEGEGQWLKRALAIVVGSVDLKRYLANPALATSDGVDEVFAELYVRIRSAVFHAKNGRPVVLPQDLSQRDLVANAKERYTRLYLDLAHHALGATFGSGGVSSYAAQTMGRSLADIADVAITSDDTPLGEDVDDEVLSPRGETTKQFPASYDPSLGDAVTVFHIGTRNSSQLTGINSVSRFGSVHKGTGAVLVIERLPGRISLADFDALEIAMGLRVRSGSAPKEQYAT